jgi:IclR family acetate operon transcriptional repressor
MRSDVKNMPRPRKLEGRKVERRGARNPARKTLQVLRSMAEAPGRDWGVREMAKAFHMSPSSAHRILATLGHEGLVGVDSVKGRYRLSLEFFRMAWRATVRFPFRQAALPALQSLAAQCNETAFLGLYDPTRMEMMFVEVVESSHPLRYELELNRWLPVYAGASGLAIMAFLPEPERRAIMARTRLASLTDRTISDPDLLEKEMAKIREQGYACTQGQRIPGAVGMAAPIWGPDGRVIGDLILTIPDHRFDQQLESRLARLLVQHAQRVTRGIGGQVPGDLAQ